MEESLRTELVDGVLWLTLNRPQARNALNHDLRNRLQAAVTITAAAPAVRVVVIAGDEKAFSAGGDVKEMTPDGGAMAKLEVGRSIVEAIARLPKPVVAAVRGHAAGAGFSMALGSDFVVADTSAVFRSVFVNRGLVPDMGATFWLARQVGLLRAKEIMLTGRPVSAREAYELGIVSRLFEPADFAGGLKELVAELAQGPTIAYGATKRLLNATFGATLGEQLDAEALSQVYASGTDDHRASVAAFLERRPHSFKGA
jgi:2-(1,2-epoxy-1,2-dihydrophenyl)acetyl-CoA isomerase